MLPEVFKPIKELKYIYHISNYGRLKRMGYSTFKSKKMNRFRAYFPEMIILSRSKVNSGYLAATFDRKHIYIHRLVAKNFINNPENKPYVNHKDGNKLNNYVENLEWVTATENVAHALNSGLYAYGEKCKFTKLSKENLSQIIELRKTGKYSNPQIGAMFGVSATMVSLICSGKRRKRDLNELQFKQL